MSLSETQIERYCRQIVLPEVGSRGQQALLGTAAAVAGDGLLARLACLYLTAAGIGRLDLLCARPSQQLRDLGRELRDLDPGLSTAIVPLSAAVGTDWARPYAILLRAGACEIGPAVEETATARGIPLITGDLRGGRARIGEFAGHSGRRPCPNCDPRLARLPGGDPWETTLEPAAAGVAGSLMSLAAVADRLGQRQETRGEVIDYDARSQRLESRAVHRDPNCRACKTAASGAG